MAILPNNHQCNRMFFPPPVQVVHLLLTTNILWQTNSLQCDSPTMTANSQVQTNLAADWTQTQAHHHWPPIKWAFSPITTSITTILSTDHWCKGNVPHWSLMIMLVACKGGSFFPLHGHCMLVGPNQRSSLLTTSVMSILPNNHQSNTVFFLLTTGVRGISLTDHQSANIPWQGFPRPEHYFSVSVSANI